MVLSALHERRLQAAAQKGVVLVQEAKNSGRWMALTVIVDQSH
jgi:hypothetical protein